MARGGKREGGGRPPGTKTKRDFIAYWNDAEISEFAEFVKDAYKEDMRVLNWVGDHIFGRPMQSIDHTTAGKELPAPITSIDVLRNDSVQEDKEAE